MKSNVKTRIRMLAGAALVALAVAGIGVTSVSAERNTGGTSDPNCSATGATLYPPSSLDYEFFPPGDLAVLRDPYGGFHTMRCGPGGVWTELPRVTPPRGWHGGVHVSNIPGRIRR